MDYPGNDLNAGGLYGRVPGNMKTADECRQACIALPDCVGFTFVKVETVRDNCAVKAAWVVSTANSNANCCDSAEVTDECRGGMTIHTSYLYVLYKLDYIFYGISFLFTLKAITMIIIPTTIIITTTINMTQMKVRLKTFDYLHNVSILIPNKH